MGNVIQKFSSLVALVTLTLAPWSSVQAKSWQDALGFQDNMGKTCGDVVDGQGRPKRGDGHELFQKQEQCTAAYDIHKAITPAYPMVVAWGGVAAMCTMACACSGVPWCAWSSQVCQLGSMGVGVVETTLGLVLQSNYQSSLSAVTQIAGVAQGGIGMMSMAMKGSINPTWTTQVSPTSVEGKALVEAGKDPNKASRETDVMACVNAAIATATTAVKAYDISLMVKKKGEALENASKFQAKSGVSFGSTPGFSSGDGMADPGRSNTLADAKIAEKMKASPAKAMPAGCSDLTRDSGSREVLQCAVAADPMLPRDLAEKLPEHFEKLSGVPFDDFMKSIPENPNAAAMISAALAKQGDGAAIAEKLSGLEKEIHMTASQATPGTTYASSGGGAGGADGSKNDIAQTMSDFMAQLMGKSEGDGPLHGPGVSDVRLGAGGSKKHSPFAAGRYPASLETDRSVSLFDRVGQRYRASQAQSRVEALPWATPFNRSSNR